MQLRERLSFLEGREQKARQPLNCPCKALLLKCMPLSGMAIRQPAAKAAVHAARSRAKSLQYPSRLRNPQGNGRHSSRQLLFGSSAFALLRPHPFSAMVLKFWASGSSRTRSTVERKTPSRACKNASELSRCLFQKLARLLCPIFFCFCRARFIHRLRSSFLTRHPASLFRPRFQP